MGLSFANPLALWTLLGLPVVVLIHYLQSRERQEHVSTLFLLDLLPEETRRGAVFTRLLAGPQLWCQLLAVLLFALLLARPMRLRPESVQTIAIVVDLSASMQAFHHRAPDILRRNLEPLARAAGRTEWHILPSHTAAARLYTGSDLDAALRAIQDAPYLHGPHDPAPALDRARRLTGEEGSVLYLTDHPPPPREGLLSIGIGHPAPNSGLAGIHLDPQPDGTTHWEAALVHWGPEPLRRRLDLLLDGQPASTREITLRPGAIAHASGELPPGTTRGELRLADDAFPLDNRHPFVVPPTPDLPYALDLPDDLAPWADRLTSTLPGARHTQTTPPEPFALWRTASPSPPAPLAPAEILILTGGDPGDYHPPVAEDHPLVRDLSWDGLLARPRTRTPLPGEQVLLWMGPVPLVSLLPHPRGEQLLLNLHLDHSNADRSPALVLLVHRFLRTRHHAARTRHRLNLETHQRLPAPLRAPAPLLETFTPLDGPAVQRRLSTLPTHAPAAPGSWTLTSPAAEPDTPPLLRAAVAFGALEEADLTTADAADLPADWIAARRERHSQRELLRPWLYLLLALALLGAWTFGSPPGETA